VDILFRDVIARLEDRGLKLTLSDAAKEYLAEKGYDEKYGARPLRRAIQRYLEDPFSEELLQGRFAPGDEITIDVHNDRLKFNVHLPVTEPEESVQEEVG
jgi:ATP-dependent Clp protease ATP-binding subunit ClpC